MSRKEEIKELFTFTKGERNGVFILFFILMLVIGSRLIVNNSLQSETVQLDTAFIAEEIKTFKAQLKEKESPEYISRLDRYIIERYDSLELFRFNPNTTSAEEWKQLGLTDKQIESIQNFTSKGGTFYDKNDFRRMYGIRTRQYQILEPYINLPERYYSSNFQRYGGDRQYRQKEGDFLQPDSLFMFNPNQASMEDFEALGLSSRQASSVINYRNSGAEFRIKSDFKKIYTINDEHYEILEQYIDLPDGEENAETEHRKPVMVDINALSEDEFKALGSFWQYNARGIVNYRELLGGYVSKEQLLEVWGVKEHFYRAIENDILPLRQQPKQIRINFASVREFARHPYIEKYDAEAIVNHRSKNGPFKDISDFRKYKLVSQTTFDKLEPYLTAE